jgi:hypothetical protein
MPSASANIMTFLSLCSANRALPHHSKPIWILCTALGSNLSHQQSAQTAAC